MRANEMGADALGGANWQAPLAPSSSGGLFDPELRKTSLEYEEWLTAVTPQSISKWTGDEFAMNQPCTPDVIEALSSSLQREKKLRQHQTRELRASLQFSQERASRALNELAVMRHRFSTFSS